MDRKRAVDLPEVVEYRGGKYIFNVSDLTWYTLAGYQPAGEGAGRELSRRYLRAEAPKSAEELIRFKGTGDPERYFCGKNFGKDSFVGEEDLIFADCLLKGGSLDRSKNMSGISLRMKGECLEGAKMAFLHVSYLATLQEMVSGVVIGDVRLVDGIYIDEEMNDTLIIVHGNWNNSWTKSGSIVHIRRKDVNNVLKGVERLSAEEGMYRMARNLAKLYKGRFPKWWVKKYLEGEPPSGKVQIMTPEEQYLGGEPSPEELVGESELLPEKAWAGPRMTPEERRRKAKEISEYMKITHERERIIRSLLHENESPGQKESRWLDRDNVKELMKSTRKALDIWKREQRWPNNEELGA